jgi:hypothetical protein
MMWSIPVRDRHNVRSRQPSRLDRTNLATHRRCNQAKASDVFNEASARFFLHRAEGASANVQKLVTSKKKRESREILLSTVGASGNSILVISAQEVAA